MKIHFKPHPAQKLIYRALVPALQGAEVMVIAGRRFGKTVLAVNVIIKRAIEIPYARIWYIAPTKDQAYRIAWRVLLQYLPKSEIHRIREDRHWVELKNGSLIEFLGTQDQVFLLGAGLHFVVLDEFPTIPHSVWEDVVRPMLADYNGDALFIGTVPDPKIHNISPEFLDMYDSLFYAHMLGEAPQRAFNFSSFENPYINHTKVKSDIEKLKKKGREKDAQRLYYGKYTREYGLVFPKFDYEKHTVEPFEIPKNWTRAMAVDPHPQKPVFALWMCRDPRGHIWFYREQKFEVDGRPLTIPECSYKIISLETEAKEKIRLRLIDPTFAKVEQKVVGTKSVVKIFKNYGLFFREANRNFMTFFNEFSDRLVAEPEPTVHIFRTCPGFINQLKSWVWASWASVRAREEKGAKDKPKAVNDDYISCSKYLVNANVPYINDEEVKLFKQQLKNRWENQQYL